ncbi:hypothetical protein [Apilactobacillus micheneri]|uniref:hypothetical protein n=1 Tax=Apilactobacillus micheneri TaxID=1899430 RepID=UPI000D0278BB|nr:hypothetical protein [Apilactobacillus micheneri]TPR37796.1 hypothetical protein DY116_00810 [Apilactobacillus micheneri]
MKNIYKIMIAAISALGLLFIFNLNNDVNVHAFVHSKQEIQKNSELFEAADYSASTTTDKTNRYASNHFLDNKAKNYIYNLYRKNAEYLTKNYEFYDELGESYFYNGTPKGFNEKFTNYYQYAKYAAEFLINNNIKTQHHFKFSIKHRSNNDYFSYNKWEKGYINPKWIHYSYSSEADGYSDVPLYDSLSKANKFMKNSNYYGTKTRLDFYYNANQMLGSFYIKKKNKNAFMIKIDNKVYYVPRKLYSSDNKQYTIFEKYNTYVDKNIIWSSIDITDQKNDNMMVFNKNANLNNQRIWNMSNGNIYYKYRNNMWQANSLTYG